MMISISILLLFLIPIVILVVARFQVRAGYIWLLAMLGALTAWLLVLFSRSRLPQVITLIQWKPEDLFNVSPTLLLDETSWVYAVALVTFPLAVLLSDVLQFAEVDSQGWATSLAMTGLGLLAVMAENPLTLMLAWMLMDVSETWMLLQRVLTSAHRERVVVAFSVRMIGMLLVLVAMLQSISLESSLVFESIPPQVSGLLLLAAGLRLGVLPPHQPFFQEPPLRRGLGTIVRMSPVASSLVILSRIANVGLPVGWQPYILAIAAISALYGAVAWAQASNELDGRPFWILGMATIALVAAVFRLPNAVNAWGLGLLMSGCVLFLTASRSRFVSILAFVGILGVSALPYTPSWGGGLLYYHSGIILLGIFVLAHSFLILGYIRHALRPAPSFENSEQWMHLVYPSGLILLIITHWSLAWSQGFALQPGVPILSSGWWGGAISLGIGLILVIIRRREVTIPLAFADAFGKLLSLEWIYRIFWWLYRTLIRVFSSISQILEGEGGILWSLLMLILLIALVVQQSGG